MNNPQLERLGSKLGPARRRSVSLSPESMVKVEHFPAGGGLPAVVRPAVGGVNLAAWARGSAALLDTLLLRHGAVLFRDFGAGGAEGLEQFIAAVSGSPLEYRERSSPRTNVGGNIYTSTDYPKEHAIFLHNENSYQQVWPLKLFFYCARPADRGGETPLADCRNVYRRLRPETRERFARGGWMYVRNFSEGFGLPWQSVFQTTDRAAVEQHCRRAGIEAEWKSEGRLCVRAVRPAVAAHPRTGEPVWFNHATFFHVSTLAPAVREELLRNFDEADLPTNTYYGDGSPIEPSVLEELREAYRGELTAFAWEAGDLLMVDNMLVAHGRASYAGERKILVGMAEPSNGFVDAGRQA
ncbi:MAG TPA: TauD/TfdA family dioxygenase [Pyrinomonadaceae bacterium]|jgi:alpha-ketoglutarate-dependent taurine dioxygenase|nr:TauD/TfdA family dioxygenase [Pyrinomonadaceae bacterium]